MLFRPHRGSLEDSMKQVQEVNNISELISVVKSEFMFGELMDINENTIEIDKHCYDGRINWNTHIVILNVGQEKVVVGFMNGKF